MRRRFLPDTADSAAAPFSAGKEEEPQTAPSAEWARNFRSLPADTHEAVRLANATARAKDPRPNILFLYTDQQTLSAMSCSGNPWVRTPHMDQLARHGVSFRRSYCPAPVCGPSRASLVTGRHPHEHGVRYNGERPRPAIANLGESLRAAGYDTTWTGKWHLPESYPKSDEIPGFHYLGAPEGLLGLHLGGASDMHFAMRAAWYLRWHAGLSAKPWFLGVSLHNPHDICHFFHDPKTLTGMPEPDPGALVPDGLPPLPPNHRNTEPEPELLTRRREQKTYCAELGLRGSALSEAHWRAYLQTYYHMTQSADRCLGPVLHALRAGGWLDNTLVIFTSDHGEGIAAHEWFTKLSLYEETLQVPFIILPPGALDRAEGRADSARLVSGLDVMPTCLDCAGVPPSAWPPALRGRSLRPLVENSPAADAWRDHLVIPLDPSPERPAETARAVISSDNWKYALYSSGARNEALFNLTTDPGELRNLAAAEPARRDGFRALLQRHIAETNDPFPLDEALRIADSELARRRAARKDAGL